MWRTSKWLPRPAGNSSVATWLPTALAAKVKQSVASVCPSVCSTPLCEVTDLWTWVCACVCVCHNHSSPGIESQGHRRSRYQRSMSSTYGCGNKVTQSVWPRFSIEDVFSSWRGIGERRSCILPTVVAQWGHSDHRLVYI